MDLRDEDDQVAQVKQWWSENGNYVLGAIGLAIAGTFGWNFYSQQQADALLEKSAAYQAVLAAESPEARLAAAGATQQLAADTEYGRLATLLAAQALVETDDFAGAASQLSRLVDSVPANDPVGAEARLRLSLLEWQAGNLDAALALASADFGEVYQARALELQGDLHVAAGDLQSARDAYTQALEFGGQGAAQVRLKLNDLAE